MLNKHIKKLATLTFSSFLIGTVHAEVFKIDVQVTSQKDQNLLGIAQTQEMSFPELVVGKHTKQHSTCWSNVTGNQTGLDGEAASNGNSLCPRLSGKTAKFKMTGIPDSKIHVGVRVINSSKNGLKFAVDEITNQYNLSSTGELQLEVNGLITLSSSSLVKTQLTTFEYEFVAYYT